jgi:hypothetical protein
MLRVCKDNVARAPVLGPLLATLVVLNTVLIFDTLASGGERVQQVLVGISRLFGA